MSHVVAPPPYIEVLRNEKIQKGLNKFSSYYFESTKQRTAVTEG